MFKKLIKKSKKSKRGFTLIELIVVIAILGILAAVLVPTVSNQITTAKQKAAASDASAFYMAATLYKTGIDNGDSGTALDKNTSYTDKAKAPLSDMLGSKSFASINSDNITAINLETDANGEICYVSITGSNGTGTYGKINSSAVKAS